MEKVTRRQLFHDTLSLLIASAAFPSLADPVSSSRQSSSQNEKIHIAVLGLHGRGMDHLRAWMGMRDVEVIAVCDPDTSCTDKAIAYMTKQGRRAPRSFRDLRKLLEVKELDAISIATPNHWHSLAGIWAMQAGKDVYVEKPVSHNVHEGVRLVDVSRQTGRMCQAGTQSRSSAGIIEAMKYVHDGKLGKVSLARGLCYKPRGSIGLVNGPQQPPATVDYDIWLGPAPDKPVMRRSFHYDWHWFWDYGNGDIGNQGVHEMDKARWALNRNTLPKKALGFGGRFGYKDDGQTPNTFVALMDWGDAQLVFEVRGLHTEEFKARNIPMGTRVGNVIYGDQGIMVIPNYTDAVVYDLDGNLVRQFRGGGDHFRNFIDAVRSRKRSELNAEIEQGNLSSALCHLPNVSYLLGKQTPFNARTKAFGDEKEAYEALGRVEDHLAANNIVLADDKYDVGPVLSVNANQWNFGRNAAANKLATAEYRAPYLLPEK